MPALPEVVAALQGKLINQRPYVPPSPPPPEPIRLADYQDAVTEILANDPTALLNDANDNYYKLSEFIQAMNPYGGQAIIFPDLGFTNTADRTKLTELREQRGIEVAGWLRASHSQNPKSSSDTEMTIADKTQCFYWDFRFPDDPTHNDGDPVPPGGEMRNLQITKAIRIPFVYRRADTTLLLGHLLIGYEGAGNM